VTTDTTKCRRRGPQPLPAGEKRRHAVSVRLNAPELAKLDGQRSLIKMQRGEYLRAAALHRLPPTISAINREAWTELAREAANLNQIAKQLNQGLRGEGELLGKALAMQIMAVLENNLRLLMDVRRYLIGVKRPGNESESK
jgi:hypothetical protein